MIDRRSALSRAGTVPLTLALVATLAASADAAPTRSVPTSLAAETVAGFVTISNRATGMFVDGMDRTTNGANTAQHAASSGNSQQWLLETAGDHVRLRNRATGLHLDGAGATADGADLSQRAGGDSRWLNYTASVDVSFENDNTQGGANYALIGVREQHGDVGAPYKLRFSFDGGWQLLVNNTAVASGNVATGEGGVTIPRFDTAHDAWHNIAIRAAGDTITALLDGAWAHENGKAMYNVQRSLSTSQGAGAALTYTITGTGLDILGPNNGSAVLEVAVDGVVVDASASTTASPEFYQTFTLRNLTPGRHTVRVTVREGTLVVDAVGIVPGGRR